MIVAISSSALPYKVSKVKSRSTDGNSSYIKMNSKSTSGYYSLRVSLSKRIGGEYTHVSLSRRSDGMCIYGSLLTKELRFRFKK